MNELNRIKATGGGGRPSRAHIANITASMESAKETAVELHNLQRLYSQTMRHGNDLDNGRQVIAINNPEVAPLLMHLEVGYFQSAQSILFSHASRLDL